MDLISQIRKSIKEGKQISGKQVRGLLCLSCPPPYGDIPFIGTIEAGLHEAHCLWNYFVSCPRCSYENNLAKYARGKDGEPIKLSCECK